MSETIRYIAFLRGINVSGQKLIKMEELRKAMTFPGFSEVKTYIQSGNIVFDALNMENTAVEAKIEKQLESWFGFHIPVVVRKVSEMAGVIASNPFPDFDGNERKLYVTFLKDIPDQQYVEVLRAKENEHERFELVGSELYFLLSKVSYGNTLFSNTYVEKTLKLKATTRNWATVNKVIAL